MNGLIIRSYSSNEWGKGKEFWGCDWLWIGIGGRRDEGAF